MEEEAEGEEEGEEEGEGEGQEEGEEEGEEVLGAGGASVLAAGSAGVLAVEYHNWRTTKTKTTFGAQKLRNQNLFFEHPVLVFVSASVSV